MAQTTAYPASRNRDSHRRAEVFRFSGSGRCQPCASCRRQVVRLMPGA